MGKVQDMVCVILAGGRGKRMGKATRPKACRPVAGRAAVVRAIDTYKAAGLQRFLVVVGHLAERVTAAVAAAHPDVEFAHQPAPRGTGDAAAVAADALAGRGSCAPVLIVMGDRLPRVEAVRRVLDRFGRARPDAVITTGAKTPGSTSGRVVIGDDGGVLGIVEPAEIRAAARARRKVHLAGRAFTAAQIEKRGETVNLSMYAFRFRALREALGGLRPDNAQGELYLTDAIGALVSAGGRVETVRLTDPDDLLGFNTAAELRAVERAFARRGSGPRIRARAGGRCGRRAFKPAAEWIALLAGDDPKLRAAMEKIYGHDAALLRRRRGRMLSVARAFARRHGDGRRMILVRAPGRINLMGRHVDHRGGHVNVIAIPREVLLAAAPRDDEVVALRHVHPGKFPAREFRIGEFPLGATGGEWTDLLNSPAVGELLESARGDWGHYARAALLRLRHDAPGAAVGGMDCVVAGDIPVGAGLSSSSALLVAFAEAAAALNGLSIATPDFVDLCGQAEWFVGSRGGSADHAAIKTCRRGQVSRLAFRPFRDAGRVRFPDDLRVVVAHSGGAAAKSAEARDLFNQRVACYEIAMMLLRRLWPAARQAEHVRDLAPCRLNVPPGAIYRALTRLPVRPTRRRLREMVPATGRGRLDEIFATHANIGPYDLRGVMLYGIGECIRGERFADLLRRGALDEIGRLMRVSHDGDRLVRRQAGGSRPRRHVVRTDDASLLRMAAADADPAFQCGRYACSTEAIDHLVDVAGAVEGVIGAQLAGAGLGGVATILVRDRAVGRLLTALRKAFYRPRNLGFDVQVAAPVAGSGPLKV